MYHEELDKINDIIYEKVASDDNSVMCKNVKELEPVEKTVFCAYQYYLEQMNDGFMAIFTGYMSPLVFEIREALKEINAKANLELLNLAIEYDGSYFHKNKVKKDEEKNLQLNNYGVFVIRIRDTYMMKKPKMNIAII